MKILKHSLLLFRINPDSDKVKVLFIYVVGWFNLKFDVSAFDLKEIPMSKVVDCYKTLEEQYDRKYRI
jgi:hypothetical protein